MAAYCLLLDEKTTFCMRHFYVTNDVPQMFAVVANYQTQQILT